MFKESLTRAMLVGTMLVGDWAYALAHLCTSDPLLLLRRRGCLNSNDNHSNNNTTSATNNTNTNNTINVM